MNDAERAALYISIMDKLTEAKIPFLIGGTYAYMFYVGIRRWTKDLDIFIHPRDAQRVVALFNAEGYEAFEYVPHWLVKVHAGEELVDFIYGASNGVAQVDDEWFEHAVEGTLFAHPVKVIPVEEMIWSKAFVMARDRFDGGGINHLLKTRGKILDWRRLLDRFASDWPVLFSHVILFEYTYPSDRDIIPAWVEQEMNDLWRMKAGMNIPGRVTRGTRLSDAEYWIDIERWGYEDGRLPPLGNLQQNELRAPGNAAA